MKEYTPSKGTFIVGTLDQYTALASLVNIASYRTTQQSQAGTTQKHLLATHIYESLARGGNPIASVLDTRLNFTNAVHDRESTFDQDRAVAIMKMDPQYTRALKDLGEVSEWSTKQLATDTIIDKVNQQTQLYCAQVTMATCHDVMNGNQLTNELVEKHTQEKVIDVLEHKSQLQKQLSVEILALNNLKEEVLSDMSHIEFQQQFHHELKNISPMDTMKLNELHTNVVRSNVQAPEKLESLRVASAELSDKHDISWQIELPNTTNDIYAVMHRENIPFTSDAYVAELSSVDKTISSSVDNYLGHIKQELKQDRPTMDLAEVLKNSDIGPSM